VSARLWETLRVAGLAVETPEDGVRDRIVKAARLLAYTKRERHEAREHMNQTTNEARSNEPKMPPARSEHDAYTRAVEHGLWPFNPTVPLGNRHVNDNGEIQNLLEKDCGSVTLITSKDGAIRANHLHREDWHYAFVISGRVYYYERAIGSKEIPEPFVYGPGEMFFTPPMREHAMRFEGETKILTMSKRHRTHEEHEADVVRVDFLAPGMYSSGELNGPR